MWMCMCHEYTVHLKCIHREKKREKEEEEEEEEEREEAGPQEKEKEREKERVDGCSFKGRHREQACSHLDIKACHSSARVEKD